MREQLIQYVDLLFAGATGAEEIQQEILQNTLDRYDDLIAQGRTPQAAYQLAIGGIGDIQEILGSQSTQSTYAGSAVPPASTYAANHTEPAGKHNRRWVKAFAIALFILCAVPVLLFENSIGVCACLAMITVGVVALIVNGKDTGEDTYTASTPSATKSGRSAINRGITGGVWGVGLCTYFLVSFQTGGWHITWLIFPILGSICGLIDACFDISKRPVGAILRLILFLLLLGVLASCVLGLYYGDTILSGSFQLEISGDYNTSEGSVDASTVQSIEIQWVSGSISIQPGDTDTITFTESFWGDNAKPMIWKQSGDKLILQFSESTVAIGFGSYSTAAKDLVITVPSDWIGKELSIESVSADLEVSQLVCKSIELNNVSGKCEFTDCSVDALSLETVSGNIRYQGDLNSLECDSVSADCEIYTLSCPSSIEMEGISCNLILYLPEECGFTVTTDSLSGDFSSEFSATAKNGKYIYGDGSCRITAESASGDIIIRKAG